MKKHHHSEDETSIINTILSDVNAIIPNFFTLIEGYRLLVGATEEIKQMGDVSFEIFERSLIRCDRTGTLIDILLELLCCKIKFSSEFLSVTCAPVDIIEQLSECNHQKAEKIVLIETMRRLLENIDKHGSCFSPASPMKPPPKTPTDKPKPPDFKPPGDFSSDLTPGKELATEIFSDIEDEADASLATEISFTYFSDRSNHQKSASPLSRKHI